MMERYLIKKQKPAVGSGEAQCASSSSTATPICDDGAGDGCSGTPPLAGTTGHVETSNKRPATGAQQQKHGRGYSPSWKTTYRWLLYDEAINKVFCTICREASEAQMPLPSTSRDKDSQLCFVTKGFSNWKKALQRFQTHEASSYHKAASSALGAIKRGVNVVASCTQGMQKEMKDARKALLVIISSVQYLACQGLAIRGHDDAESNLRQLLELRSSDVPELKGRLQS